MKMHSIFLNLKQKLIDRGVRILTPRCWLLFLAPTILNHLSNTFFILTSYNPTIGCWYAHDIMRPHQIVIMKNRFYTWLSRRYPAFSTMLINKYNIGYPNGIYCPYPPYIRPGGNVLHIASVTMANVEITNEIIQQHVNEILTQLNTQNQQAKPDNFTETANVNLESAVIPNIIN